MSKLSGKIAVITGGNSGIGLATAKLFAAEGAQVVITGRRKDDLDAAVKDIGNKAYGVQGDVSKLADLDQLFADIKQKFGHIDILFANAGIGELSPVDAVTEDHFDRQFDINVKGLFFTVQKALPLIKNGGSILLTSSIVNTKGMGAFSVYSATKAAVRSFARSWTTDLKDRKIRVNSISPGPIDTPIFNKMGLTDQQAQEMGGHIVSQVPMGRFGTPEEIAKSALFLASDDSSYITGIDMYVDGGMAQV
jgi:NAD(P)-dependent dehydrogenase (short-subunit alcohol dehydrogenase family)